MKKPADQDPHSFPCSQCIIIVNIYQANELAAFKDRSVYNCYILVLSAGHKSMIDLASTTYKKKSSYSVHYSLWKKHKMFAYTFIFTVHFCLI